MSLSAGCAVWLGEVPALKPGPSDATDHPVQRAPVALFVERPEIVDNDDEKDVTPFAENFSLALQQRIADYACVRNAFARCSAKPSEGAYRLASKVIVDNFRQGYGGFTLGFLGGLLLPPLVGMAWAFPVAFGSCDIGVQWSLISPEGEPLWQGEGVFADGFEGCESAEYFGWNMKSALDEVLPAMANAASGAEEVAARARAARPVEVALPVKAPEPAARREVLAVFDVQDVANQFKDREAELSQLTAFLATAMAATGKFTVVPREQLRDRLVDEKKASYRQCFDNACQIEMGKAVSAQKTLATQLLKVGSKCAVVANLYDLHTETASSAAMVQTECDADRLLGAMQEVSAQISAQAR